MLIMEKKDAYDGKKRVFKGTEEGEQEPLFYRANMIGGEKIYQVLLGFLNDRTSNQYWPNNEIVDEVGLLILPFILNNYIGKLGSSDDTYLD